MNSATALPPRLLSRWLVSLGAALYLALALAVAAKVVVSGLAGLHGPRREVAALAHARDVLSLERALHLDVVPALNAWLAPHQVLRVLADYEYAVTYVISAFALIFWVWARRPELFRWARDSFVLLNVVAIACFALYPVTPPRLQLEEELAAFAADQVSHRRRLPGER